MRKRTSISAIGTGRGMRCQAQPLPQSNGVLPALANVADRGPDVLVRMYHLLLGEMAEHLDAEPAVEIVGDALAPWAAENLGGEAPDDARLRHDVVGQRIGAFD